MMAAEINIMLVALSWSAVGVFSHGVRSQRPTASECPTASKKGFNTETTENARSATQQKAWLIPWPLIGDQRLKSLSMLLRVSSVDSVLKPY
jgi:hypothetical protein